jgi:endonuclease/exonuclease/phosphatase family metal-dependent hydrolase
METPMFLAGGFNALGDEEPILKLKSKMSYGREISNQVFGPDGSINAFANAEEETCIDYIFVSGFHVISYAHKKVEYDTGRFLSDHRPVIAICQFNTK